MKNRKRLVALLAAGILASSSSAAFAAQLPQGEAAVTAPYSSSQYAMNITEKSHTLTSRRFVAEFDARSPGYQFREMTGTIVLDREVGMGTSSYQRIGEFRAKTNGSPYQLLIDEAISLNPGERLRVTVRAEAYAFEGYIPVGLASGSQTFYFTL